jgi:hypothetical protein
LLAPRHGSFSVSSDHISIPLVAARAGTATAARRMSLWVAVAFMVCSFGLVVDFMGGAYERALVVSLPVLTVEVFAR